MGEIVIFTIGDICHELQPRDAATEERKVLSVAEIPSRSIAAAPQSQGQAGDGLVPPIKDVPKFTAFLPLPSLVAEDTPVLASPFR